MLKSKCVVTNAELAFDAVVQAKAELKAKVELKLGCFKHGAESNTTVEVAA